MILYLDIDGVVSSMTGENAFGDGRVVLVDGYHLNLSRELGARLAALDVDVRWLTTWGTRAADVADLLGVPRWPLAMKPPRGATSSGPWKFDCVRDQIEADVQPFAWVDDAAIDRNVEVWADNLPVRSLLLRPDPRIGLSPPEVDVLEDFIESVTAT